MISIKVRVIPNAKLECVKKVLGPDNIEIYRVYVTSPPEDGRANKSVISVIAKMFKVSKSKVCIKQGTNSRDKVILIYT